MSDSAEPDGQAGPSVVVFKKRKTTGRNGARTVQHQQQEASDGTLDEPSAETSVQDLVTLRQLARKPTGIELTKLNRGERSKSKKRSATAAAVAAEADSDGEEGAGPRRLVRKNNFQGETGTVDVDKHMMAYIEQQMRQRERAGGALPTEAEVRAAVANHPHDDLYAVAEKYKALQRSLAPQLTQEQREGDVSLSAAMLTSIPEVDLGIASRLRNIEQTEQAKRLHDQQKPTTPHQPSHTPTRFMQPKTSFTDNPQRRQTATDQVVLDRFKQRQNK